MRSMNAARSCFKQHRETRWKLELEGRNLGPLEDGGVFYSVRSATIGLIRVARRAGNQVASSVAIVKTVNALANAGGSNAPTSNRMPLSILPVAAARSRPSVRAVRSMIEFS